MPATRPWLLPLLACSRAAHLQVAEVFTGTPGKYVDLKDTITAFKGILGGKYDDLPEMAFYMIGDIQEAIEKADKLAKDAATRKEDAKGKVGRQQGVRCLGWGVLRA